jgi:hypothetical protein
MAFASQERLCHMEVVTFEREVFITNLHLIYYNAVIRLALRPT